MTTLLSFDDLRQGARALRRRRGFAGLVAVTLGLGIGATVTAFSAVDRLLIQGPSGVRDSRDVRRVFVTTQPPTGTPRTTSTVGWVTYAALRAGMPSLENIAAYANGTVIVGRGADAHEANGVGATASLFPLLGVAPALGRLFGSEEDSPDYPGHVVVLDHGYWLRHYGGDRSVVGREVILSGTPYSIIGVLPRDFIGISLAPVDLWLPHAAWPKPRQDWETTWNASWLTIVGRLRPEASPARANAEATTVFRGIATDQNAGTQAADLSLRPLMTTDRGEELPEASVARWLGAIALIVLIIACANVANLMLGRALDRRREIALRLSLGSDRVRLLRLLLAEGLVLAAFGGMAGLLLAYGGVRLVRDILLTDVAWAGPLIGMRLLLATVALTAGTALLVAIVPLASVGRLPLADILRSGNQASGARRSRTRGALLVVQTALTIPLLVGAGLFVQSLRAIDALPLGFEPDRVLVGGLAFVPVPTTTPEAALAVRAQRVEVYRQAAAAMAARPDVEHASVAVGLPLGNAFGVSLRVPGLDSIPRLPGGGPFINAVSSDYFATVGTAVTRGREFTADEGALTERVAIVNQLMARTLWPGADPLGQCLVIEDPTGPCSRVVGVASDVTQSGIQAKPSMQYYIPLGQEKGFGGAVLLVRPRGEPRGLLEIVRQDVAQMAPGVNRVTIEVLQDRLDPQIRPWRLGASMFGMFGGIALLVGAVGLYSVLVNAVVQRSREFAIRLALGAPAHVVIRDALLRAMGAVAVGLVLGIAISLAAARFIQPLLFQTSAMNAQVFAVVAGAMGVMAALAALSPARRVSRVDPQSVLQAE